MMRAFHRSETGSVERGHRRGGCRRVTDERRKAERFPMKVPIRFGAGSGTTRDISGVGVYFETDYPFEAGGEIDFALVVPDSVNVRCRGTIVRVDPLREHFGVAATL